MKQKWLVVVISSLVIMLALPCVNRVAAADLSDEEAQWLVYMREEEKLARDVYEFLYGLWGSRIFNNIRQSEQTHMDAVKTLLDRYGVSDPAEGKGLGEFTNPEFRELYVDLTQLGSLSVVGALNVGVFIEETDIKDLTDALLVTTHKDIRTVYGNLLDGSLNHLKAFTSNLSKYGVTFEP